MTVGLKREGSFVGLELPKRLSSRARRAALALVTATTLLAMGGCSSESGDRGELEMLGMPLRKPKAPKKVEEAIAA